MKMISYLRSNKGQGFVEYLFIIGLIALMIFIIIQAFGTTVGDAFTKAGTKVTQATEW